MLFRDPALCRLSVIFAGLSVLASPASATLLTLTATADDTYTAYVSLAPTTTGTQFLQNVGSWSDVESGSVTLTPGVTNYLHIEARDLFGAPSMLLAEAGLSDAAFSFSNGSQRLVTNGTDWGVSLAGFGGSAATIVDLGANGTSPWGNLSSIGSDAHYIWSDGDTARVRYFTVAISPVPEPSTLLAFGGLSALALRRRAKR